MILPLIPMVDIELIKAQAKLEQQAKDLKDRREIAIVAMQGLLASGDYNRVSEQEIAIECVKLADALINELKKK